MQVYLLTIIPPLSRNTASSDECDSQNLSNTSFVWSQVRTHGRGQQLGALVPGRCHSVSLVCKNKLLIFGGSAFGTTNAVVVMELQFLDATACIEASSALGEEKKEEKQDKEERETNDVYENLKVSGDSVILRMPEVFGTVPIERFSALCAQVGKFFLIQGGYAPDGNGCLSDCMVRTFQDCGVVLSSLIAVLCFLQLFYYVCLLMECELRGVLEFFLTASTHLF